MAAERAPADGFYWGLWKDGRWEPVDIRDGEVWVLAREYAYALDDFVDFRPLHRPLGTR